MYRAAAAAARRRSSAVWRQSSLRLTPTVAFPRLDRRKNVRFVADMLTLAILRTHQMRSRRRQATIMANLHYNGSCPLSSVVASHLHAARWRCLGRRIAIVVSAG